MTKIWTTLRLIEGFDEIDVMICMEDQGNILILKAFDNYESIDRFEKENNEKSFIEFQHPSFTI